MLGVLLVGSVLIGAFVWTLIIWLCWFDTPKY